MRAVGKTFGTARGGRGAAHAALLLVTCLTLSTTLAAQEEVSLLEREPFDEIRLNSANGGTVLEVFPLDLSRRPLTTLPTAGQVTVRLLDRPTEEFDVSWSSIAGLRVFEQMLMEEAQRLSAANHFDGAYDYFARLLKEYPSYPGLDGTINDYLRRNALALYQAREYDRSLAILLALAQRDAESRGLATAVEAVAGQIIEQHLRRQDYAAARSVLDVWQNQFQQQGAAAAAVWQQRFQTAADRQLSEANRLLQQKDYIGARKAAGRALVIWPSLTAAGDVQAQVQREFPFVTVGVLETSPSEPRRRIDSWAALRTSRLVERLLVEQVGFGTEGGIYRSPYGELSLDDSGLMLSLRLRSWPDEGSAGGGTAAPLTADSVARYLLRMADPNDPLYRGDLAALVAGVSIGAGEVVEIHLNRPHVRPESLLQMPPPSAIAEQAQAAAGVVSRAATDAQPATGPESFEVADYEPPQVVFRLRGSAASPATDRLQAIVEQTMSDDQAAIAALLAGEVDVLDRVPPWQVERLRAAPNVQVRSYRLPTVHVLLLNPDRPLCAKREFRRALGFGIDRQWVVNSLLLGGEAMPGFEVLSGPFPAGLTLSDPLRYAYNNQVALRPFEPRLAAVLVAVAWSSILDPKNEGNAELTPIPAMTLAHPSDPLARLACQAIQSQLEREGISVKLLEHSAEELAAGDLDYDLRYAELAVWEPVADGLLVVGPSGIAGGLPSAYLTATLRKLDTATNWTDVRARLAEVHEIAHHDLPVIPLWQTVNYFAYRTNISGIGDAPLLLYQNVEQWSSAASGDIARRNSNP